MRAKRSDRKHCKAPEDTDEILALRFRHDRPCEAQARYGAACTCGKAGRCRFCGRWDTCPRFVAGKRAEWKARGPLTDGEEGFLDFLVDQAIKVAMAELNPSSRNPVASSRAR